MEEAETSLGASCRVLTDEEREKLKRDVRTVSQFRQEKLEADCRKNWDKFYNRHSTHFFKDRHWTKEEFQQLCPDIDWQGECKVLEAGCGVGNLIFPLIEAFPNMFVYACDFSVRAVNFVKANQAYDSSRCHAFVCDLTEDRLSDSLPFNSVDVCTLVFVLSAILPDKMRLILDNIHQILKPDGCVIIRDYGLYDHAMLRFDDGHKLMENFYVRQDGTRAYYFSREELAELFVKCGYVKVSCNYVQKETTNRKENLRVPRVFVQGRFRKRDNNNQQRN